METFEAITSRRAVKRFDPTHRMTEEEIRRLMGAVILSPTSYNIQNWRFVLVTDQAVKEKFREYGYGQVQFADCSLIVLVCGDRLAYDRDPARYWAAAGAGAAERLVPRIRAAYEGKPERQRDENLRSGALAAQTLMLAARAMGYDTCPMVGFDFRKVADLVKLPPDHDIVMAVTVGRALGPARPRGGQLPLDEVVFRDSFPG